MHRAARCPTMVLAFLLMSNDAWSVPPVAAQELAQDCRRGTLTSDESLSRCALYVAGFLDGAVATDSRVAENVMREYEQGETLTERAIRTRVGERMIRYGSSVYAEYCVGEPVPVLEVIEHLRSHLEAHPPHEDVLARDALYATLRKHYPCRDPIR